jgi:hypothetical protein
MLFKKCLSIAVAAKWNGSSLNMNLEAVCLAACKRAE